MPDRLPLTVAIIARDEADRIEGAITGIEASEVLVLDSGSTDGTPQVARSLGARVIETDWPGHVAQKNRALAAATQPWVLCLDADERPDAALAEAIRRAVLRDPEGRGQPAGYTVLRRNHYLGAPIRGGSFRPTRHLRLVCRSRARWGGEDPHDVLAVEGTTAALGGFLEHHPYRSLGEHLATIDRYTARFVQVTDRRVGWMDLWLRPPAHLLRALLLQGGWRDGARGVILAWLGAAHVALKWGRLMLARRSER